MLDFLKISVTDVDEIERLWKHPNLIFHDFRERLSHLDYETILTKRTKKYKGIVFALYNSKLEILFKPHYYFNGNEHNANDFGVTEAIWTVQDFISKFQITNYAQYQISNLEAGINFNLPGYGDDFPINVAFWKRNEFLNIENVKSKEAYKSDEYARANRYKKVKLYSKYLQMEKKHCEPGTLRFEVKSKKSSYIKRLGIDNIGDLVKLSPYSLLADELYLTATEILIIELKDDMDVLKDQDKDRLRSFRNPLTWRYELMRYERTKRDRNRFNRMRQSYNNLLDRTGSNIHHLFQAEVKKKLDFLGGQNALPKKKEIASFNIEAKKVEASAHLHINKEEVGTTVSLSDHYCEVTGLSLQHEGPIKKGGKIPRYIRTKSLEYLRENDKGLYLSLATTYVPKVKYGDYSPPKGVKTLLQHTAKNIKNRFYNSRRKTNDKEKNDQERGS
ncbi:hypothetical protein [Cytophaga sp. FL35]|uniref:hypothetical protein n=1 Tax=Cytophaga sp. FL35 TaxID=1904456 RepID=UPI00165344C4|nr:hypothetical protein [Cytophaga sp. FL35]MBC6999680.1 hypothetical protein [Cytophaga sp. FL35]